MSTTSPVADLDVTLQVSTSTGETPTLAQWSFGDGQNGSGVTVSHHWPFAGTYQVSVQATLADGRQVTTSASVTVSDPSIQLSVAVSPTTFTGDCTTPHVFTFTATIQTNEPKLSYQWMRSDNATSPAQTSQVTNGTLTVTTTWSLSASYSGWEELQILSPFAKVSNHADFTLTCTPPPPTLGTATVSPPSFTGDCASTVTFHFSETITVHNGPASVTYKWIRSDGAIAPTQTLTFPAGTSTQTVTDTWTISASYTGWEAVQIESPAAEVSNHADFTLTCT